jgi:hypothetical protein
MEIDYSANGKVSISMIELVEQVVQQGYDIGSGSASTSDINTLFVVNRREN